MTRAWRVARVVIPLGFLGVFFLWPVAAIISRSLTADALRHVLSDRGLRHVAWFTLWQALVATALTLTVVLFLVLMVLPVSHFADRGL